MSAQLRIRWTAEEYLGYERQAEVKSEFLDGELFAMAGASREHNLISLNVAVALHPQMPPSSSPVSKLSCPSPRSTGKWRV